MCEETGSATIVHVYTILLMYTVTLSCSTFYTKKVLSVSFCSFSLTPSEFYKIGLVNCVGTKQPLSQVNKLFCVCFSLEKSWRYSWLASIVGSFYKVSLYGLDLKRVAIDILSRFFFFVLTSSSIKKESQ